MNCIIVDDEPLAREAMKLLIEESDNLQLIGSFNSAATASDFMEQQGVDLVFLDIQMPGITGIEFARTISKKTLVIFTTAYTEYALDSYEVDAIDYLIKPVEAERFQKAVDKALSYHSLLLKEEKEAIETIVAAAGHHAVYLNRQFRCRNIIDGNCGICSVATRLHIGT